MTDQSVTRQIILEPSLRGIGGHHQVMLEAFVDALKPDPVAVAAHASWRGPVPDGAMQLAPFLHDRNEAARIRQYGWLKAHLITLAQKSGFARKRHGPAEPELPARHAANAALPLPRSIFADDITRIFSSARADGGAKAWIPSGDAELLLAVGDWLAEQKDKSRPRVIFRVMYPDDPNRSRAVPLDAVLAKVRDQRAEISFACETEAFAQHIEAVTGVAVVRMPHPSPLPRLLRRPFLTSDKRLRFFVPGQARNDKGQLVLEGVLAALRDRHPAIANSIEIVLQGRPPASLPVQVSALSGVIDAAQWQQAWADCDAVLLLHGPRDYRLRGSGLVCDAVAAGRPYVCLAGTSLVEWATGGNAEVSTADPAAIADAIARIATSPERYLAAALSIPRTPAQAFRTAIAELRADQGVSRRMR